MATSRISRHCVAPAISEKSPTINRLSDLDRLHSTGFAHLGKANPQIKHGWIASPKQHPHLILNKKSQRKRFRQKSKNGDLPPLKHRVFRGVIVQMGLLSETSKKTLTPGIEPVVTCCSIPLFRSGCHCEPDAKEPLDLAMSLRDLYCVSPGLRWQPETHRGGPLIEWSAPGRNQSCGR